MGVRVRRVPLGCSGEDLHALRCGGRRRPSPETCARIAAGAREAWRRRHVQRVVIVPRGDDA